MSKYISINLTGTHASGGPGDWQTSSSITLLPLSLCRFELNGLLYDNLELREFLSCWFDPNDADNIRVIPICKEDEERRGGTERGDDSFVIGIDLNLA